MTTIHGRNSAHYQKKADVLWADIIKQIADYQCQLTFKQGRPRQKDGLRTKGLESHHLIERGQIGYRYDLDNGICLCKGVHGSQPRYRSHKFNAHGLLSKTAIM